MKTLWSAALYWPLWLCLAVGAFLVREVWALASGRPQDTLSDWVWRGLKVTVHQPMSQWGAAHFLIFAVWIVLVVWLTRHFFWRGWA